MHEGTLRLRDGRRLAYAEWGARDAAAVLYFHGSPGCRREMRLTVPVLERRGVVARIIGLNRPGYGPSTFKAGYGFLDWPNDVAEVVDQLELERFAVLGASGGCPFALACGLALPDRITRIGIVVGVAPRQAPGMNEAHGIAGIPVSPFQRRLQCALVAVGAKTPFREPLIERIQRGLGETDRRAMQRPELRAWFIDLLGETFSGLGRGAAHEAGLYLEPWGFDPSSVTSETLLWYGGEDQAVPASAGRWLAARLPNATFTEWPQHGHFTWAASDQAAEVLSTLVAR